MRNTFINEKNKLSLYCECQPDRSNHYKKIMVLIDFVISDSHFFRSS